MDLFEWYSIWKGIFGLYFLESLRSILWIFRQLKTFSHVLYRFCTVLNFKSKLIFLRFWRRWLYLISSSVYQDGIHATSILKCLQFYHHRFSFILERFIKRSDLCSTRFRKTRDLDLLDIRIVYAVHFFIKDFEKKLVHRLWLEVTDSKPKSLEV